VEPQTRGGYPQGVFEIEAARDPVESDPEYRNIFSYAVRKYWNLQNSSETRSSARSAESMIARDANDNPPSPPSSNVGMIQAGNTASSRFRLLQSNLRERKLHEDPPRLALTTRQRCITSNLEFNNPACGERRGGISEEFARNMRQLLL